MPSRTRPIEKFAEAVAKCSAEVIDIIYEYRSDCTDICQASVYGKCIAADYNGVYKDKCLTEFLKLKDCYTVCCCSCWGICLLTRFAGCLKTQINCFHAIPGVQNSGIGALGRPSLSTSAHYRLWIRVELPDWACHSDVWSHTE